MLTSEQLAILGADIAADPQFAGMFDDDIAKVYNQLAAPEWVVWRTNAPIDDIMRNGMDWARVDNLTAGKARIWDWMGRLGTLDASKPNIRGGIDATWVGTAADLAVEAYPNTAGGDCTLDTREGVDHSIGRFDTEGWADRVAACIQFIIG